MITQTDVMLTMQAANPETTEQEAQRYFQQIETALDSRFEQVSHQLRQRWIAENGREPDGLTWGRILNRAQIDAENQIRQEYLAELTEQAVQQELETQEAEANRIDPERWTTEPWEMQVDESIYEEVDEVWPDKPTKWTLFAGALFATMQRQDITTPYYPEDERVPELEAKIDQAYQANAQVHRPLPNRG